MRLVTAIVVACAVFYAPMAEAEHVEFSAEVTCDFQHTSGDSDGDQPDHSDHDHHAHHCGPCLQHILRQDHTPDAFLGLSKQTRMHSSTQSLASYLPGTLYRPPRA